MNVPLISWVRGYVVIRLRGGNMESLLNKLTAKHMEVWSIRRKGEELVELHILVRDFFRLRPLLKQTGSRVHVLKRYGFPFLSDKLWRRKFFAVGLIGFIMGLYLLSSVVWQVNVEGNDKVPATDILKAAEQVGIYPAQWKFKLQDTGTLSNELMKKIPGMSWIGVQIQGTKITIKVVEATNPDKIKLMNPRNLVATKNALVTEIYAEKGRPLVTPNTYVRKGDILISGVLGDEENRQVIVAKGTVRGIVWYTAKVEVPLTEKYKVLTGDSKDRLYVVIGNRAIQITGYGKIPFTNYEIHATRKSLHWKDLLLPFGTLNEKIMQVKEKQKKITVVQANKIGESEAKLDVLSGAGKDAKVINTKILQQHANADHVSLKLYFEVEEQITAEQPIILENNSAE